ncbi:MAG: glycoside-pentoside-hexuronide (GPH):cation symporter [Parasporobacterium sp.]|nr:glycoside-pentoside-hexuronide (GPH):cation symporter [Parasporobacterium sp.]
MEKKIGAGRVIGYGLGSMGKDLALGVIGSYLLAFYTDVFGISAVAAGAILVLTKIWDAVNDPIMGAIADHSKRTRWGKYRPFVLFVPIPLAVFSALCFLTPDWSMGAKILYAAITYTITGMLFTAYDVPLWGMLPSLTSDFNTRNKLTGSARTFTTLAMLIASSIALPAIYKLGGGMETENLRKGYPLFMFLIGIVGIVCALIAFASTKEVVYDEDAEKQPREKIFKQFTIIACKPLIIVLVTMVFNGITMILPSVAGVYYMTYYLHRPDMIPFYMMISMGMGLITSISAPLIMKKIGPKTLSVVAFAASAIAGIIIFFVGVGSLPLLFVLFSIPALSTGILMVTITTLLTMTSDYIAKEKGKRYDGVVFSMNSLAIKIGQAVAGGLVSAILAITHYQANVFEQTEEVANGILATRSLLPAIIAVIGLIVVLMFKLPNIEKK